jgi:circadian clock protein KaiB
MTVSSSRQPRLRLRLYIAGRGLSSTRAEQNLARLAEAAGIDYELELIDLRRDPARAELDSVVVTPTLVKLAPKPRAMVIGDLEDLQKVAAALGAPLP